MKLFLSPHSDDAVLFGCFTLLREKPVVLTVFESHRQEAMGFTQCSEQHRRMEDIAASVVLGVEFDWLGAKDTFHDLLKTWLSEREPVTDVWLPMPRWIGGHPEHNSIANVSLGLFPRAKVHRYLTYSNAGKETHGNLVPHTGAMLYKKLQALACYRSQIVNDVGCAHHFIRDQNEYTL